MTNFDVIAERIVAAEGVSFAIACALGDQFKVTPSPPSNVTERREALRRAIVEALRSVHMDAVSAMSRPIYVYPDRTGDDIARDE